MGNCVGKAVRCTIADYNAIMISLALDSRSPQKKHGNGGLDSAMLHNLIVIKNNKCENWERTKPVALRENHIYSGTHPPRGRTYRHTLCVAQSGFHHLSTFRAESLRRFLTPCSKNCITFIAFVTARRINRATNCEKVRKTKVVRISAPPSFAGNCMLKCHREN